MSPLTKAFVVVVTILSVLLVALVVPFVAKTQDFQSQLNDANAGRITAERAASSLQNEIAAIQDKDSQRVIGLNAQVASLTADNTTLQNELARANRDVSAARAELQQLKADLARLTAAADLSAALLDANTKELNTSRDDLVSTQTKLIESVDKINELEATVQGYTRQVNRLKENAQAMAERTAELEGVIANVRQIAPDAVQNAMGASGTLAVRPIPTKPISGKIDLVDTVGDQSFVQIDVGQSDGVEENMEFLVHRGNEYIGTLVVQTVDASKSAGVMEIEIQDVEKNDNVYAGGL